MNSVRTSGNTAATGGINPNRQVSYKKEKGVDTGANQTADHGWGDKQNNK